MKTYRFLGTGIGHENEGKRCQDRLDAWNTERGSYVYVVSDGCSSSAYAEQAAQCNVDVICKIFSRIGIRDFSRDALMEIYPELAEDLSGYMQEEVEACLGVVFRYELSLLGKKLAPEGFEDRDLSATVLFAVVEEELTLAGHIGDGNIIFYDENGDVVFRSEEKNGESSNRTFFTISRDFTQHFECNTLPTDSYSGMILFSDGPQRMFKMESGSIEKGAYEIVMKPIVSNQIRSEQELASALQESLYWAMHYGFDDWAILAATKEAGFLQEKELPAPHSLLKMFMEIYERRKGQASKAENTPAPAEVPEVDEALPAGAVSAGGGAFPKPILPPSEPELLYQKPAVKNGDAVTSDATKALNPLPPELPCVKSPVVEPEKTKKVKVRRAVRKPKKGT